MIFFLTRLDEFQDRATICRISPRRSRGDRLDARLHNARRDEKRLIAMMNHVNFKGWVCDARAANS